MATQPSDLLSNKILAQNRARSQFWGNRALAAEPMSAAAIRGGPAAAAALSPYFFPNRSTGISQAQGAGIKAKILKDMTDLSDKMGKNQIGIVEALGKQNTAFGDLAKFVDGIHGNAASANASVAGAFNGAVASIGNEQTKAIMQKLTQTIPDPAGLQHSIDDMMKVMANGNVDDPALFAAYTDMIHQRSAAGDGAGAAAASQYVELYLAQHGVDIRKKISEQAAAGDQDAQNAQHAIDGISQDYSGLAASGLALSQAQAIAQMGTLKTGAANMDQAVDTLSEMMKSMGVKPGNPEETARIAEDMIKGAQPKGGGQLDNYKKLLDQIDSDTVDPSSTLGEARRRLFADPEFQEWKKQNGFQDDGMALKELRRLITEKSHQAKQADRKTIAGRLQEGVGPNSGPTMSAAAKLTNKPANPQMPPENSDPTESKVVMGPDGLPWIFEDGKLRPSTDDELTKFGDPKTGMIATDPKAWAALLRPASEYAKYKTMSDQANSRKLMEQAGRTVTADAMTPKVQPPDETIGTQANEAGFLATHPGELVNALLKKSRKKKTDEQIANQAGVLGDTEDMNAITQ